MVLDIVLLIRKLLKNLKKMQCVFLYKKQEKTFSDHNKIMVGGRLNREKVLFPPLII